MTDLRKCFHYNGSVLCLNVARRGSLYCDEHQLTPAVAARLEARFGRLAFCRACAESFRTKDPNEKKCAGCRRFG